MNVKVKELKGKLRSNRRIMLIAALCGDDLFVAKAIDGNPKDVFASLDKWKKEWESSKSDDDKLGDIANNAIVSLKEVSKGNDSVERASYFLKAFTSLCFESKDELALDDYCNAVCQLRLLQELILPKDKIMKSGYSRKSANKIKNFVAGGEGVEVEAANFLTRELDIANKWAEVGSRTEEEKNKMDDDESHCASLIVDFVKADEYLMKKYGCRLNEFANWTAEQIYGMKPEIVESVRAVTDDQCLVKDLFEQYICWLKNNDAIGFEEYLRDSTKDIGDDTSSKTEESSKENQENSEEKKEEQSKRIGTDKKESEFRVEPPRYASISDSNRKLIASPFDKSNAWGYAASMERLEFIRSKKATAAAN